MSVAGITSAGFAQLANVQRNWQQVQSEFKQLGQDLQTGNLTQAQADFVTLSQSLTSNPQIGTLSSVPPAPASPPNAVNQPTQSVNPPIITVAPNAVNGSGSAPAAPGIGPTALSSSAEPVNPPTNVGPTALSQATSAEPVNPPTNVGPTALSQATPVQPINPPTFVGPNAMNGSTQTQATSGSNGTQFQQTLSQLGQALQAGDLTAAQQAFAAMEQIWQTYLGGSTATANGITQTAPTPVPVSVSV